MSAAAELSIAIEGVIGVGKTTLAKAMAERLGAVQLREADIENPFLDRFYKHRDRWALACQLSFLEGRIVQFARHRPVGLPVVADHSLIKDPLFAQANIEDVDEWDLYCRYFAHLAPMCRFVPRVTVFLTASIKEVRARIRARGRKAELQIEIAYLEQLVDRYEAYFQSEEAALNRVVVVSADGANIAQDADAVDRLIDACRTARPGLSYCNPVV